MSTLQERHSFLLEGRGEVQGERGWVEEHTGAMLALPGWLEMRTIPSRFFRSNLRYTGCKNGDRHEQISKKNCVKVK